LVSVLQVTTIYEQGKKEYTPSCERLLSFFVDEYKHAAFDKFLKNRNLCWLFGCNLKTEITEADLKHRTKLRIMVAIITYAVLLLMVVSVMMYLSYRDLKQNR